MVRSTAVPGAAHHHGARTERMRTYWNQRAVENAAWFVDTTLDYAQPDMERFMATGRQVVDHAFTEAVVRPEGTHRAVEIGSGLGRLCAALAQHFDEVIGIDIAPEMVRQADQLVDDPRVTFHVGSGASLDAVDDGSADFVLSFTVFQHIPDPSVIAAYLVEAGRVLRPGGVIAFQWNNEDGARRWRVRRWVLDLLQRTGLRPERRGRNAAEFLGSKVPLGRIREMLTDAGLELEHVDGEGTLFAWAWARRTPA